jgi:DnaJ-class molecular chaperone
MVFSINDRSGIVIQGCQELCLQTGNSIVQAGSTGMEHRRTRPVEPFSICKGDSMNPQSSTGAGIPAPSGQRNPGDESAPGTPQTAEDICPECQGSGKQGQGDCVNCGGSGRIVKIIGDA